MSLYYDAENITADSKEVEKVYYVNEENSTDLRFNYQQNEQHYTAEYAAGDEEITEKEFKGEYVTGHPHEHALGEEEIKFRNKRMNRRLCRSAKNSINDTNILHMNLINKTSNTSTIASSVNTVRSNVTYTNNRQYISNITVPLNKTTVTRNPTLKIIQEKDTDSKKIIKFIKLASTIDNSMRRELITTTLIIPEFEEDEMDQSTQTRDLMSLMKLFDKDPQTTVKYLFGSPPSSAAALRKGTTFWKWSTAGSAGTKSNILGFSLRLLEVVTNNQTTINNNTGLQNQTILKPGAYNISDMQQINISEPQTVNVNTMSGYMLKTSPDYDANYTDHQENNRTTTNLSMPIIFTKHSLKHHKKHSRNKIVSPKKIKFAKPSFIQKETHTLSTKKKAKATLSFKMNHHHLHHTSTTQLTHYHELKYLGTTTTTQNTTEVSSTTSKSPDKDVSTTATEESTIEVLSTTTKSPHTDSSTTTTTTQSLRELRSKMMVYFVDLKKNNNSNDQKKKSNAHPHGTSKIPSVNKKKLLDLLKANTKFKYDSRFIKRLQIMFPYLTTTVRAQYSGKHVLKLWKNPLDSSDTSKDGSRKHVKNPQKTNRSHHKTHTTTSQDISKMFLRKDTATKGIPVKYTLAINVHMYIYFEKFNKINNVQRC